MLEDDHSKQCGNFIAKNANIERCTQLGDILDAISFALMSD